MSEKSETSCIYVLAGTNGGGKSSIAGAMFIQEGAEYFNPDEVARRLVSVLRITQDQANSAAWYEGVRLLERAITRRHNFAFETTLGGNTITTLSGWKLVSLPVCPNGQDQSSWLQ